MLEKLNTPGYESISKPSASALKVLGQMVKDLPDPTVAEVGVGIGATTVEMLKLLDGRGTLHLYDFDDVVTGVAADIGRQGLAGGTQVVTHGNGRETYNSYAWQLAINALESIEAGEPLNYYEFVYLDGAHVFHHDAAAVSILREMINPGGYLIFDDMYWTFAGSPTLNPQRRPQILQQYSTEQIERPHIEIVVKLFMETDPRFEQVYLSGSRRPYRPVFRRL